MKYKLFLTSISLISGEKKLLSNLKRISVTAFLLATVLTPLRKLLLKFRLVTSINFFGCLGVGCRL